MMVSDKVEESGQVSLRKSTSLILIATVTTVIGIKAINLLFKKILTTNLTDSDFSYYSYLIQITAFLAPMFTLAIHSGVFRYIITYDIKKDDKNARNLFTTSFLIVFILQTIPLALILLLSMFSEIPIEMRSDYSLIFILIGLILFAQPVNTILVEISKARQNAITYSVLMIGPALLHLLIGGTVIVFFSNDPVIIFAIFVLTQSVVYFLFLARLFINEGVGSFSITIAKDVLKYSINNAGAGFVGSIYGIVIISLLMNYSPTEVGLYDISITIANLFGISVIVIQTIVPPVLLKLHEQGRLDKMMETASKTLVTFCSMIIIPFIGVILFSEEIILFISTPDYLDASTPIPIFLVCQIIIATKYILTLGFAIRYRSDLFFYIMSITTMVVIVAAVFVIPSLGVLGVSIVELFFQIISFILLFLFSQRLVKVRYDYQKIAKWAVILTISLFILYLLTLLAMDIILVFIIFVLVYTSLIIAFKVLDLQDLLILKAIVKK